MSRCRLRNHAGILYCVGFWMMVTIRSSSSEVSSPALYTRKNTIRHVCFPKIARNWDSYRLFRSTSAFLQTKLEYRRPTPLILVRAYMTFCLPSTLVLRRRKIYSWLAMVLDFLSLRDQKLMSCDAGNDINRKSRKLQVKGKTHELKVRLLSRDERHAGQLYRSLPCARWKSMIFGLKEREGGGLVALA